MKTQQVTFTFEISDPELSGEDIFEQVQMLMLEEFHDRAEVFYGSPDELVSGDDAIRAIGKSLINGDLDDQTPIWGSVLTRELVEGWTEDEVADLSNDLDQSVMLTIADHEARRQMVTGDTEV